LDAQLEGIIDEAREDEGLADRIPEAEAYADEIRAAQYAAFSDASAGASLTGIGASTRVSINSIKSRLQGQLDRALTADEVDQRLAQADDDARLLLGQMNNALTAVMEDHGLDLNEEDGTSSAAALAAQLFDSVAKDIENIKGQAIALADLRKAAIQNEQANAAEALYEATKAKATEAGAAQAALGHELDYYLGQAMQADTDEEKTAADAKVTELEEQIEELELVKQSATVQAERLLEGSKNSQALAKLADEIATAKADSDAVIDGLVETQERYIAAINARWDSMDSLHEVADTLRYEAETETNELFVSARWAAFDAADAAIDQALQDNEDDQRLVDEYDFNIRQVRNSFRITKAQLVAERTNAELMVAIKQEMNFGEDIEMIDDRKTVIRERLLTEEDVDKMDLLDVEWDELSEQLEHSITERAGLQVLISDLIARVTEMDAVALTITAVIDNEEAQIALEDQYWREWGLQL